MFNLNLPRLIADMSKFILKHYFSTACINVYIFRIQTAAAIQIQTLVRIFLSKCILHRLIYDKRNKAATKITQLVKIFLARRLLLRLKKIKELKIKNIKAVIIQSQVRRKLSLKRFKILKALREREILLKRVRAASVIQKAYRDYVSNKWTKIMRDVNRKRNLELKRVLLLKNKSVIIFYINYIHILIQHVCI